MACPIQPGGRPSYCIRLSFAHEVSLEEESPADLGMVDEKELDLAKMLVNAQRAPFYAAKLKDKFHERVLELVERRAPTAVPGAGSNQQRKTAPVVDIMDALRRSLDAARKPPQSEGTGRSPRKKDKRHAK
jgi:DNA end-binding protein Ku